MKTSWEGDDLRVRLSYEELLLGFRVPAGFEGVRVGDAAASAVWAATGMTGQPASVDVFVEPRGPEFLYLRAR